MRIMIQCKSAALRLRSRWTILAFGLACALLAGTWLSPVHPAHAGSAGNITVTPSSGPVGTQVTVEISVFPSSPQAYDLKVTATDPTQGSCSSAQLMPGIGPVTVGPQGGSVQFSWPSALSSGQYWFCASPQSGIGASATSTNPYTVTTGATPTTPIFKGGNGNQPTSAVLTPATGATAGSQLSVAVAEWITPDNAAPVKVTLVSWQDGTYSAVVPFQAQPLAGQPGNFKLTLTLPANVPPGSYAFEIGDAYNLRTDPFQIVAHAAATPTPAGTSPQPSSGLTSLVVVIAVVALLLLAVIGLVVGLVGRRRAAALRRQQEIEQQRREEAARRAQSQWEPWRR